MQSTWASIQLSSRNCNTVLPQIVPLTLHAHSRAADLAWVPRTHHIRRVTSSLSSRHYFAELFLIHTCTAGQVIQSGITAGSRPGGRSRLPDRCCTAASRVRCSISFGCVWGILTAAGSGDGGVNSLAWIMCVLVMYIPIDSVVRTRGHRSRPGRGGKWNGYRHCYFGSRKVAQYRHKPESEWSSASSSLSPLAS
ncbi:uncharacterized protein K489DRAFT_380184 [Dissoconium aciculare CBS 342.82]|uniref:Uncharacterized protein n=1 Tax=Dissoconium aciculare CBS 342.82 TaxID=1314786 RepID=A0A6J3M444_9PEZI|nr:uncharacterized protein K489DRAFT_380184 [Dissoconium aciculare CBS 342.82]KAF1822806.1 hypothetical protein K489DRAFT_380184 [Dissoconium aciculare CBS 342.82]